MFRHVAIFFFDLSSVEIGPLSEGMGIVLIARPSTLWRSDLVDTCMSQTFPVSPPC